MTREIRISCDNCAMQNSEHCATCVVSFLCGAPETDAVVFDMAEARAMRMLAKAGLIPHNEHVPKTA